MIFKNFLIETLIHLGMKERKKERKKERETKEKAAPFGLEAAPL